MLYAFLFYLILATCPTHPNVCELITAIIFAKVYRSSMWLVGIRVAVRGRGLLNWFSSECSKKDIQYFTFVRIVGSPAVMIMTE
jgi:hypothetical protein